MHVNKTLCEYVSFTEAFTCITPKFTVMRKLRFLLVMMPFLTMVFTPIRAQIEVIPDQYDFGELSVGESESQNFTITNSWWGQLVIESTVLFDAGGSFALVNAPPDGTVVPPESIISFGVSFSPASEGMFTAQIVIDWTNGENGISTVELSGSAIAAQPPPLTIQDILNFFDTSVANGSLTGTGPGKSGENRLNAVRNMLIQVSYFLSAGNYEAACDQLGAALKRCNDFLQGGAQNDLMQMISGLMNGLGC
jgi:hypothetical protein